ncbi:hypothetical protein D3C86_1130170 [compost metagenome]
MYLSSNQNFPLDFLIEEFPSFEFRLFVTDTVSFISCIACWCRDSSSVVTYWRDIQSVLSARYQPEGALAKWNIYLVFFCPEVVAIADKYIIENDKYSVRKLIVANDCKPDSDEALKELNDLLLGHDLELSIVDDQLLESYSSVLATQISGVLVDATDVAKQQRAELIANLISEQGSL